MTKGVLRHLVGRVASPEAAFMALAANAPTACWWESLGERGTQRSYLGFGEPLELISGTEWQTLDDTWASLISNGVDADLRPPLGIVGWFAYDLTREALGVDVGAPEAGSASRSRAVVVDRAIEWDLATGEAWLWAVGREWQGELLSWRDATEAVLLAAEEPPEIDLPDPHSADTVVQWRDSVDDYRDKIRLAKDHIRDGDVYQLCVTTEVVVERSVVDHELYRLLRRHNPAPHQALLRIGNQSMVASSPETFLDISREGLVVTKPIKGTRPRLVDPGEDAQIARELQDSEKEQAENLMIVDLMRNDLSRVCDESSVQVPQLLAVETYPSVHQLVSTVTGQLAAGQTAMDALRACFPGGSMTGAPKHRAVSLLVELESGERGSYSGCFGLLSADGSLSVAMTIRTAMVSADRVSLGVGGGITWSSEVDAEVSEVGHKARALLRCLGVSTIQYS